MSNQEQSQPGQTASSGTPAPMSNEERDKKFEEYWQRSWKWTAADVLRQTPGWKESHFSEFADFSRPHRFAAQTKSKPATAHGASASNSAKQSAQSGAASPRKSTRRILRQSQRTLHHHPLSDLHLTSSLHVSQPPRDRRPPGRAPLARNAKRDEHSESLGRYRP